jgi:hypothetical protein
MRAKLVRLGVAAGAAVGGFVLQQALSARAGRSSLAEKTDRLKEVATKPVEKIEDLPQNGGELLADLGRRVSSRFNGPEERQGNGDTHSLDELAARRRERAEARRRRSSAS